MKSIEKELAKRNTPEVVEYANRWEQVVEKCGKVPFPRGKVDGYPTYSAHWYDTWCVLYNPSSPIGSSFD